MLERVSNLLGLARVVQQVTGNAGVVTYHPCLARVRSAAIFEKNDLLVLRVVVWVAFSAPVSEKHVQVAIRTEQYLQIKVSRWLNSAVSSPQNRSQHYRT